MSAVSRNTAALLLCASLAACSSINPLGLLTGSGPNVAANIQAGKTNTQTIGTTRVTEQKLVRPQAEQIVQSADENQVTADLINTVIVGLEVKLWHIFALMAWTWFWYEMPAPRHIRKWISEKWNGRLSGKS